MKWLNQNFGTALVLAATTAAATAIVSVSLCRALEPKEILVVAYRNLAASVGLAKYYMTKRGIPEKNLLTLSVPNTEHIRGGDYEKDIAVPVRQYLKDKDPFRFIRCLLIMYGIPLKVNRAKAPETKAEIEKLKTQRGALKKQLTDTKDQNEKGGLKEALDGITERITALQKADASALVDSEIALVLEDGPGRRPLVPTIQERGDGIGGTGQRKEGIGTKRGKNRIGSNTGRSRLGRASETQRGDSCRVVGFAAYALRKARRLNPNPPLHMVA